MNLRATKLMAAGIFANMILVTGSVYGGPIGYVQTNLTSDVPGLAANLDPNLKNPWGMSFSNTSPFWSSDQVTNLSTLYNAAGAPQALIVSMPAHATGPQGPTGQVFTGGLGFTTAAGASPIFVFATLAGTIDAWNTGTTAVTQFTATDSAIYTGLAQTGTLLYAADTRNGKIDVFNNTFQKTTVTGTFTDASVPAGFTPYDIQTVNGKLYVEYAKQNTPGGFIGVFDSTGHLLQHIADAHLNGPWGITQAPAGFGQFANDLLVGNFGDGKINAFDPTTGTFLGVVSDNSGNPIVNSGLWALQFRSTTSGIDPNTLFFTAGINAEADGLFGKIQVAPEPGATSLLLLGLGALVMARRKLRAE